MRFISRCCGYRAAGLFDGGRYQQLRAAVTQPPHALHTDTRKARVDRALVE